MTETLAPIDRIQSLPDEVIIELGKVAAAKDGQASEPEALFSALPSEMTKQEVSNLGLRVCNFAEQIVPSRDGLRHGRRSEIDALSWVGLEALAHEDESTLQSVIDHLKSLRLSGRMASFSLRMERKLNS